MSRTRHALLDLSVLFAVEITNQRNGKRDPPDHRTQQVKKQDDFGRFVVSCVDDENETIGRPDDGGNRIQDHIQPRYCLLFHIIHLFLQSLVLFYHSGKLFYNAGWTRLHARRKKEGGRAILLDNPAGEFYNKYVWSAGFPAACINGKKALTGPMTSPAASREKVLG